MRPINISLDSTTWELAKGKANFSGWVRRKLLEEVKVSDIKYEYECVHCGKFSFYKKSHVQGVRYSNDCTHCGKTALLVGGGLNEVL